MKKNFLYTAIALGMMTALTACHEDEEFNQASNANYSSFNANSDLTNGCNVLIYGQDTLQVCKLPLKTTAPVKVTSEKGIIDMTCTKLADGQYVLVPSLKSPQNDVVEDNIHIVATDNTNKTKDISVVIRPRKNATRATEEVSDKDKVNNRIIDVLCYGMTKSFLPGDKIPKWSMLDPSLMKQKKYVKENTIFEHGNYYIDAYGTSVNELVEDWSLQANVNVPAGNAPFMVNVGVGLKSTNKTSQEREYRTLESGQRRAYGIINDSFKKEMSDRSFWKLVISDGLNKILNNADQGFNNEYTLDYQGAIKIIMDYGTHLPTEVLLGGSCRLESSKTMDLTESSFETSVKLGINRRGGSASGSDAKLFGQHATAQDIEEAKNRAEIYEKNGDGKQGGSIEISNKESKISKTSDQEEEFVSIGLGKLDGMQWVTEDDPNSWAALAYNYAKMGNPNSIYIPIYDLIDPSAMAKNADVKLRYETLKHVIEDLEADGYPPYMHAWGQLPVISDKAGNYVICDFVYKMENVPDGQPFTGSVINKRGDQVEVMYYPMRWNENNKKLSSASNSWSYKTFDALKNTFVCLARSSDVYHHFYYAMLPESESYGIDAITFVPEESSEGLLGLSKHNRGNDYRKADKNWKRRTIGGYTCGAGIKSASCDMVVPYVHERDADSKTAPITAVCLFNQRNSNDESIMSTSGGTEYDSQNMYSTNRYEKFWIDAKHIAANTVNMQSASHKEDSECDNNWYSYKNTDGGNLDQRTYYITDSKCQYSWFRASSGVAQNNYIYVGYSFRPLSMTQEVNKQSKPIKAMMPVKY